MNALSPKSSLWIARIGWVLVAVTGGLALSHAVDDHGSTGATVANVLWWLDIAVVVVALVVPSTSGLTVLRLFAPLAVPASALMVSAGAGALGAVTLVLAALTAFVILSAELGEAFAGGSAYGDEHRFPLRPPAAVMPFLVLAWALWCTSLLAAAIFLAAEVWPVGVLLGAVALGLTWLMLGRGHLLSRRWLVIVPAGLVVHDGMVLGETLMVPKAEVTRAGLALDGTQAADLTGPASGHAIDIAVAEPVLIALAPTRKGEKGKGIHALSFLVAPSRPGRALRAMADAQLPVG